MISPPFKLMIFCTKSQHKILILFPQPPDYSRQITTQTTTAVTAPSNGDGGIKDDLPSSDDGGGGCKNTNMTVLEDSKISASDIEDVEKGCA